MELERKLVAIDPLALLLPAEVYVKIIEGKHPHVPKVQEVAAALKQASAAERKEAAQKVEAVMACARVVQEAVASLKG